MSTHSLWVEKYRPTALDTYICNDAFREKFEQYIQRGDIPHLLFHGTAGTGKTTAAKLLINNIDCDSLFINASDERGIDIIRDKIKNFATTTGFKNLKIVVLDEADYITPDAQAALRNLMEVYSDTTRFILTCNYIERVIAPLISRAQVFHLIPPTKKDVARRLAEILNIEGVKYDVKTVAQLVNTYYPDARKIINTAQLQTRDNVLTVSVDELIGADLQMKVVDVLSSNLPMKDKIADIRKLLAEHQVHDYVPYYQLLYQHVDIYAGDKIPQAIIAIAEGQFRDGQVPDREINFMATLYTILTS